MLLLSRSFAIIPIQLLFHTLQFHRTIPSESLGRKKMDIANLDIELRPDKLDILLHSAALFALLKAKARSLISASDFPTADAVLYARCASESGTVAQLAKCIVPLLKTRDMLEASGRMGRAETVKRTRKKAEEEEKEAETDWMGWPNKLAKWLMDKLAKGRKWPEPTVKMEKQRKSEKENDERRENQRNVQRVIRKQKKQNKRKKKSAAAHQLLRNISKMKRIQHFYELVEHCKRHLDGMSAANSEFFSQFLSTPGDGNVNKLGGSPDSSDQTLRSVLFRMHPSPFDALADELQQLLRNYTFRSFPILSPRIFSLFPADHSSSSTTDQGLFSPTLFSFHNEGLFALPTMFELISTSEDDVVELLDTVMEVAGASRILDKLLAEIEPRREMVERQLYPTVMKLEAVEKRWERVRNTFTEEQKRHLEERGYALMNRAQCRKMYGSKHAKEILDDAELERNINRMAEIAEHRSKRFRRDQQQAGEEELLLFRSNSSVSHAEEIRSMQPFVFTNKLRQGPVTINGAVLSPRAFFSSLSSPNFMTLNVLSPVAFFASVMSPRAMAAFVLSPTAFTANVLNPNALWSEVLSPKFFHTNVLSPRALAALVMAPRTMLGEVLSPKLIEARVLNPGTFFIGVLGPNILQPRVLSPSNFGITVLNPNILSPSILSKGNFTIQVLSPSIMSDDVTPEQLLRGEWQKKNASSTPLMR